MVLLRSLLDPPFTISAFTAIVFNPAGVHKPPRSLCRADVGQVGDRLGAVGPMDHMGPAKTTVDIILDPKQA
jgi:hypothetical protein